MAIVSSLFRLCEGELTAEFPNVGSLFQSSGDHEAILLTQLSDSNAYGFFYEICYYVHLRYQSNCKLTISIKK